MSTNSLLHRFIGMQIVSTLNSRQVVVNVNIYRHCIYYTICTSHTRLFAITLTSNSVTHIFVIIIMIRWQENGEKYIMWGLMICTVHWMLFGDKMENNKKGGPCSTYGERRVLQRVLVEEAEGKRLLGRSRHRWENNIKMELREVGCGGMNWIDLA